MMTILDLTICGEDDNGERVAIARVRKTFDLPFQLAPGMGVNALPCVGDDDHLTVRHVSADLTGVSQPFLLVYLEPFTIGGTKERFDEHLASFGMAGWQFLFGEPGQENGDDTTGTGQ